MLLQNATDATTSTSAPTTLIDWMALSAMLLYLAGLISFAYAYGGHVHHIPWSEFAAMQECPTPSTGAQWTPMGVYTVTPPDIRPRRSFPVTLYVRKRGNRCLFRYADPITEQWVYL